MRSQDTFLSAVLCLGELCSGSEHLDEGVEYLRVEVAFVGFHDAEGFEGRHRLLIDTAGGEGVEDIDNGGEAGEFMNFVSP